jgi:hypothetical protein
MKTPTLKAPFPYFGGKSSIASAVWARFGSVRNYVEPFCGSAAILLNRPQPFSGTETVNDADGLIANFWRAVQQSPDEVARYADNPVNENDLHARHAWLVGRKDSLQSRLEGDPDFFDAKVAGWWCWGACCWIGSGWCSGKGPWSVVEGQLVHLGDAGRGMNRKLVHLGTAGQGVNRQLVHLGNAGRGVNRKRPLITNDAVGVANKEGVYGWMQDLAERLVTVRVCCGDWSRVCGPTPTVKQGTTAVFLDPPYSAEADRNNDLYRVENLDVAHAVRDWCLSVAGDRRMRVALCGYEGEGHEDLESAGWSVLKWKARGGYESQGSGDKANVARERIWFSPHCLSEQMLF